jgi:hypothetical protein
VGLDGDDLVVGAWFDTTGGNFGAAYFFHREGGDWVQVQKINSLGGARAEVFGEAVAIDDGLAVITDSGLDRDLEFEDMGAAYVYRRGASAWSLGATITPGDYATYTTYFGTAAAVRGSSILIGAAYAWDEPSETYPGAAYAYSIARGSKLLIKNANPDNEFQNRIVFKGKGLVADVPLPGSGDDPTCAGGGTASITVSSATSGASFTQTLPCANWAQTPRGYRYVDPELDDGACRLVDFSPARTTARAVCAGSGPSVLGYDIEPGQEEAPVVVRLTLGATSYCTVFGGTVKNDGSDGQKFLSIQAGPTEPCATP